MYQCFEVNSRETLLKNIQCTHIVFSRRSTARLGKHLSDLVPIIISFTKRSEEDDEMREICLQTLESFVYRCPTEISLFVPELIQLALEYIKYDPNFAGDDDEDEDLEVNKYIYIYLYRKYLFLVKNEDEDMSGDEDDEYDDIAYIIKQNRQL